MPDQTTISEEGILSGVSALEKMAKSQIVTGGNSERKEWAGSTFESVGIPNVMPGGTDMSQDPLKGGGGTKKSVEQMQAEVDAYSAWTEMVAKGCSYAMKGGKMFQKEGDKMTQINGAEGQTYATAKGSYAYKGGKFVAVSPDANKSLFKAICPQCNGSGCESCGSVGEVWVDVAPMVERTVKSLSADGFESDETRTYEDFAGQEPSMGEGFQVAPFLEAQSRTVAKSLEASESRMTQRIDHFAQRIGEVIAPLVEAVSSGQPVLAKGLADANQMLLAVNKSLGTLKTQPATQPKSVQSAGGVSVVNPPQEKSTTDVIADLNKSDGQPNLQNMAELRPHILKALEAMNIAGEVDDMTVIHFENTGGIKKSMLERAMAHETFKKSVNAG